jgi:hypothetical protein
MQGYWEQFRGDPSTAKIENPGRQPSASLLSGEWHALNMTLSAEFSAGPVFIVRHIGAPLPIHMMDSFPIDLPIGQAAAD